MICVLKIHWCQVLCSPTTDTTEKVYQTTGTREEVQSKVTAGYASNGMILIAPTPLGPLRPLL